MIYILDQRLHAQSVANDKSHKGASTQSTVRVSVWGGSGLPRGQLPVAKRVSSFSLGDRGGAVACCATRSVCHCHCWRDVSPRNTTAGVRNVSPFLNGAPPPAVIDDVVRTMFSPKFLTELFKPCEIYSPKSMRQVPAGPSRHPPYLHFGLQ